MDPVKDLVNRQARLGTRPVAIGEVMRAGGAGKVIASLATYLGALGMPGMTAYLGLLEPEEGA